MCFITVSLPKFFLFRPNIGYQLRKYSLIPSFRIKIIFDLLSVGKVLKMKAFMETESIFNIYATLHGTPYIYIYYSSVVPCMLSDSQKNFQFYQIYFECSECPTN